MLAAKQYDEKRTFSEQYDNYAFGFWGLVMHLVLLWGILDVNFHSPIIQGLPPVPAVKDAPAKRLVLFVADGLRYRTFTESTPRYLGKIMESNGAWGVSHTHMPTESRPGNIAIVAGLYEDPSAIFKGWKENPVDFDSVLNQSSFTWAWGSPDIVPMFTKGNKGNVYGESYLPEWQDFDSTSGKALRLDSWVFDKYREWLNVEAGKIKNVSGVIMYLHLLGCDTTGHSRKPNSREYTENMYYVDERIKEAVQLTENFFGDGRTAYLFTADHGMTDWGSHGSGSTDETETPLVLWGAGVQVNKSRQDVDQADLAPLMSSLVGIPIPVNNEGILPVTFLNNGTYAAYALLNNIKQLAYQIEGNRIANCEDSSVSMDAHEIPLSEKISEMDIFLERGNVFEGTKRGIENIALAKEYLVFFRQRPRNTFLINLSLMWLGWIMVLLLRTFGVRRQNLATTRALRFISVTFCSTLILILIKHKVSGCDNWRFPCFALCAFSSLWLAFRTLIQFSPRFKIHDIKKSCVEVTCIVFLIGTMFIGLIHRLALSIGMLLIASMQATIYKKRLSLLVWSGLTLALFPTLPVVEPHPRVYIVLISMCVLGLYIILRLQSKRHKLMEISRLLVTAIVYSGLIDGRSWVSWLILMTTPICIFSYPTSVKERIQGIVFGLFCPLALLSASYEPFFLLVFATHLLCWPQPTANEVEERHRSLSTEDLAKAAFFMLYTLLCFFGTGNMSSISSFDPSWTRHFVTVFSPFTMSSLIVLKLSIPLILVGCTSYALGSSKAFLAVLLLGDCLSLPLVYWVSPQGSWLDIGSAISRFIIAITLPCLLLVLYCISRPLMRLSFKPLEQVLVPEKMHIV